MLVDRTVAKLHLGLTVPDGHPMERAFTQYLAAAEDHVVDYVSRNEPGTTLAQGWTDPASTPARAQQAVLVVLAELWRFHGDDLEAPVRDAATDLPRAAMGLLRRFTDPVLA